MSDCLKHKKTIEKYTGTLKDLAEDIGNLHYEELEELFYHISQKLGKDASKDKIGGRVKLAHELTSAAANMNYASQGIGRAWKISKPFMKGE